MKVNALKVALHSQSDITQIFYHLHVLKIVQARILDLMGLENAN